MATVPRLASLSIAPSAAPNIQLQNANTADLTTIGPRQAQQFGNALGGAGTALEQARYQATEQANALRVDDALNQAQERAIRLQHDPKDGYTTLKGYDALNREGGQPLAEEFTAKLDTQFGEIAGTLGNERQKQMFQMRANNLRTQFLGGALQYEGAQQKEYTLSVRDATVKNAADALVINSTDPKNVSLQETRIRSAIMGGVDPDSGVFVPGSAQMQGKSAAWASEKADEAVSGAHAAAISKAMEMGDMNGAMAYRKRYGQSMTATDMLKVDGTLQKNYETMRGAAIGTEIVQSTQSTVQPSDMNRLTNIVMGVESGGRDTDAAGNVLTSPKGAQGRMQVMPGTNKDPGYGVRPAADDGPEERARVGRDYLAAMVKRYDGNVGKAAAAYNWGPDAVDKAIKAKGADWLSAAPAETKDYVAKVSQQLQTGAGAPARPTLADLQGAARARLGANASPFAMKQAMDTIEQQFTAQNKAIEQRKDETVAVAYQALEQAGGRWSEVPANIRAKVQELAPDKLDDLRNFGVRASKGDDVTDDRLYLRLSTNPQSMAQMSDAQFYQLRGGLSKSDFDHFTKIRADTKAGKTSDSAGDLNNGSISAVLNSRLQGLKIDPTPTDGSADAQRVGAIRRFVDASVIDAQRAAGKKFSDAEVQQHVDGLFARNVQFKSTFLGFQTGGTTGQPLLSVKVGDIPSADAERIKRAFKAQGNDQPTDADVLGAYFAARAPARRGATGNF